VSCVFSGPSHQKGPAPFSTPLPRIVTLLAFGAHTKGWYRQAGKELRYDGGVATCGKALEFSHAHTVAPAQAGAYRVFYGTWAGLIVDGVRGMKVRESL
jgi:hypothetical protein